VLWAWSAGNGVCDGRICGGTWANPGERREAKTLPSLRCQGRHERLLRLNEAIERLRQELLSQALDGSRFRLCYDQSDLRPLPSNTFRRSRLDQQIREERRLAAPPPSPAVRDGVSPQTPAAVCVERRDAASLPHHSPVSERLTIRFREPPGSIFSSGPGGCL